MGRRTRRAKSWKIPLVDGSASIISMEENLSYSSSRKPIPSFTHLRDAVLGPIVDVSQ